MYSQIAFLALIASGCMYIAFAGAHAGRCAALIVAASSAAVCVGERAQAWPIGIVIDALCLMAFTVLAVRYPNTWLLRCGGLQLAKLATHMAAAITPDASPRLYAALLELWVLVMLATAVRGVWTERRYAR